MFAFKSESYIVKVNRERSNNVKSIGVPRKHQPDAGFHIRTNVVDRYVVRVCATLSYPCAKHFTVFYYIK